ncbi:MAG: hypothetical protein Q4B70_13635 [Lachnospiraceae bacterium]|nr:hypothetical protein [Lachnospiraceae bacterium]
MEDIINALLDVVREQQRNGVPPEAAMSRSDVVNMALKMMQEQGTEIEQETVTDVWRTILRLAPKLFGSDTSDVPAAALTPSEQIIRHMEPDKNITEGNENIALDKMIFNNFQSMLSGAGGEINTDPEENTMPQQPEQQSRPKSAAELAADAIRLEEEYKRKGIKPPQPKKGSGRPVTGKKPYKGIPKAPATRKGGDGEGVSASQLAYEAQRRAEARAREEAKIREELEARLAEEAMKRGEPDPRIVQQEQEEARAEAEKQTMQDAQNNGSNSVEAAQNTSESGSAPKREETPEEKRARVEAEQEARRAREWAEAEAEAKAAKEKARAEREAKAIAEAERAKAEKARQNMDPEEAKAAEERAARRAKAREEAKAAQKEKSEKTRSEAAKLIEERAKARSEKAAQTAKKAVESIQIGMAAALGKEDTSDLEVNEEELNRLVMEKYQEMIKGGTKASDIDMVKLTSKVIEALQNQPAVDNEPVQEDLDDLIDEAWGDKAVEEAEEAPEEEPIVMVSEKSSKIAVEEPKAPEKPSKVSVEAPKAVKVEKPPRERRKATRNTNAADAEDIFSSLLNVKSLMGDFEEFLSSPMERKQVHTGIEPVDQLLTEGLEAGVYLVQADESISADAFLLQAGDHIASTGKDVLYLLADSSRYSMMVKSISRLTYELRGQDREKARSAAAVINGKTKADAAELKKEFTYYEEQIGEHLYLLEQKNMDCDNMIDLIENLVTVFEQKKEMTPIVLIDDIFWMLDGEEDLLSEVGELAKDLETPILISVGAGDYRDEDLISTKIQISYTGVKNQPEQLLEKELAAESGETLLADLSITRRDTGKHMTSRMAVTPKFHYFDKITREMKRNDI